MITPAAHIPAVNGYNPYVPEYGAARILAGPMSEVPAQPTLEAAVAYAKTFSSDMDTAAAVFQSTSGAYLIGLAAHSSPEGPEDFVFGPELAKQIVFDDPSLVALVWRDTVATRP